jgi:glutamyl-tRNA reductase
MRRPRFTGGREVEILVLGLNHKTAPVDLREKLSVPSHRTPEFLELFRQRHIFDERLLLSTCNRTEIYGVGASLSKDIGKAKKILSEYAKLDLPLFEDKLYVLKQPYSIQHLFSVASGLDSMVVGETEITGQVKDAYWVAHEKGQTGKVLNTLFQRSFKVAKNLRSQTEIGAGRVSVASVAVDLAKKIFDDLSNVRVMVLGTGEMSTQVTRAMVSKGAFPMVVSTRHFDRAQALAETLGGEALRYETYEHRIGETDILIASTAAPQILIHAGQVRAWMKTRHEKPLFMIDIAVPRNIDPAAEKLDNVYLYNVDDLQSVADKNRAFRESQRVSCLNVVNSQTQFFMQWLSKEFGPQALHG